MIFYNESPQKVLDELSVDGEKGLTEQQAEERLEKFGPNRLKEKKKKTNL